MIIRMTPSRIEFEVDELSYTVQGEALNPDYGLDYVIYADDVRLTDPARKGKPISRDVRARLLAGIKDELAKKETRFEVDGDDPSAAGEPCPREGYWFTPAKADSRRAFKQGEVMPAFTTDYGATLWQWDERQG